MAESTASTPDPDTNEETTFSTMGDGVNSALDTIWTELDGDLDAAPAATTGPFTVNVEITIADPFALPAADDGGLVGLPISVLVPWEAEAGYMDPWALPADGMDWMDFAPYDPMTSCTDWTMDGWVDTTGFGPLDAYGPGFDSRWLNEPGGYYDDSAFQSVPGYWDTSSYYDSTADWYTPVDTGIPTAPFDMGYDANAPATTFDPSGGYTTFDSTGYDATGFDTTSSYDPNSYYTTYDTWDTSSSWDTPAVDDPGVWDIEGASTESTFWHNEYQTASDLEWDYWRASTDAWLEGDSTAAYDLNQMSLEAGAYSDQAWNYSSEAWSDPAYFDTGSSSWDTGSSWDSGSSWDTSTDTGSEW